MAEAPKYRTLFISDMHLGSSLSQASRLLKFLRENTATNIYLVGDVFDDLHDTHADWDTTYEVIRELISKATRGIRVIFIPGNHDALARHYCGLSVGRFLIEEQCIHVTNRGRRYLVIHGDCFDYVASRWPWLAKLGNHAAKFLHHCTPLWFAHSLMVTVNLLVIGRDRFKAARERLVDKAKVDGLICGHTHEPKIEYKWEGLVDYANCGDWVDSCSCVVEDHDGTLQLVFA
jgi:UDP-2,3-diacylglucosamine pyrophosphatase LpxH